MTDFAQIDSLGTKGDPLSVENLRLISKFILGKIDPCLECDPDQKGKSIFLSYAHDILPKRTYLNIQPEYWTNYVNQGWMQRAIDIGAAFKLETPLPKELLDAHNLAVNTGDINAYYKSILNDTEKPDSSNFFNSRDGGKEAVQTFYTQKFLDIASAGYVIRRSPPNHQFATPKIVDEILARILEKTLGKMPDKLAGEFFPRATVPTRQKAESTGQEVAGTAVKTDIAMPRKVSMRQGLGDPSAHEVLIYRNSRHIVHAQDVQATPSRDQIGLGLATRF